MISHRVSRWLLAVAVAAFAAGLVFFTRQTASAAAEAVRLCATVLIPSLFPFFVVSSVTVQTGLASRAGRLMQKPMSRLFGVPGVCAPAYLLGLIGGYPVGARCAVSLYEQRACTRRDAERLLAFCNNSGPAFILGAVGTMMLGSPRAGMLLYGIHVASSVLVGLVMRLFRKNEPAEKAPLRERAPVPLSQAFTSAVTSSFSAMLNVCAFVIFFAVAIELLRVSGLLPLLARPLTLLGLSNEGASGLLGGLLEVTTGVKALAEASCSGVVRLAGTALLLGWAGLSVHCQVLNLIGESGLSAAPYLLGKALHGVCSAALAWLCISLFPGAVAAFGFCTPTPIFYPVTNVPALLVAALCLCAFYWLLLTILWYCSRPKNVV